MSTKEKGSVVALQADDMLESADSFGNPLAEEEEEEGGILNNPKVKLGIKLVLLAGMYHSNIGNPNTTRIRRRIRI